MAREVFTSAHVGHERSSLAKLTSLSNVLFMKQVHGEQVCVVDSKSPQDQICDALVTTEKNLGLAVATADCLPILLHSQISVGAIHAGRKGVVNDVIANTVKIMRDLGAEEITATIGPAICGKCYEVSPEMYEELRNVRSGLDAGANHLNISEGAKRELKRLDVEVTDIEICTLENINYNSFRRDGTPNRQFGIISL